MIILYVVLGYLAAGILFAIPFLLIGITAIDKGAKESPWTFRLMLLPGCIVFWPVLLKKYVNAVKYGRHD